MDCSDEHCTEYGYYERWIEDVITKKHYYIYLCAEHCKEFDKHHPAVYHKESPE